MNSREAYRRDYRSGSSSRKRENPAGAPRQVGLVGKQTTMSNRNSLMATSFPAEWFARFDSFHRPSCPLSLLPGYRRFVYLCGPGWIKPTLLKLRNCSACSALGRPAVKLLGLHDLASNIRRTPLTKANSPGYGGVQKGGSGCNDSSAKASGSVPGTLNNQGRELVVLTSSNQGLCHARFGRFPDHNLLRVGSSLKAKRCSVQVGTAHSLSSRTLKSDAPHAQPTLGQRPNSLFGFCAAFDGILRTLAQSASALRFFSPLVCIGVVNAAPRELGAA